jgi:molybdopterin converting factor small subunit
MKIIIHYHKTLAERIGCAREEISQAKNITVKDLLELLKKRHPHLESLIAASLVSVNQTYAKPSALLVDGDDIFLIPPISGG